MWSDSSSSSASGDDPTDVNPNFNLKLVDERFGLLTLTELVRLKHNHRENGDGIANRSLNQERINDGDEDNNRLQVENEGMFSDEGSLSLSNSGYIAERGSSSATSTSRIDEAGEIDDSEIQVVRNDGSLKEITDSQAFSWVPGKCHVDEDDTSISWRKRKKHFFILSNSGKPIYSRYGDEHKLTGFSATLQAIIFFVENGRDRVKLVKTGKH
ncbi:vacuolar fusion protein MON1 homolog [Durio zibethinus]|uniref:Vacuolar fusion protein MON1 homolog n=1 Tax=Durio zibethinus TaxID=66656 RepID=A0A6P5ZUA4_DURZI|nr:vacuolar fusion protein MON1 homolog [Durio zibethinus]